MLEEIRRLWVRSKYLVDQIPHQIIHYTLGNQVIRLTLLKILAPFPNLKLFLHRQVANIQQRFFKKRILYQRQIHPTMLGKNKRTVSPINPKDLIEIEPAARSTPEILRRIEQEL